MDKCPKCGYSGTDEPAGSGPGSNTGHGHVWRRPDGVRARCGGPGLCTTCAKDYAKWGGEVAKAEFDKWQSLWGAVMFDFRPHCEQCGQFISYDRATLNGKLEGPPCVGWVEWWEGLCEKCEQHDEERSHAGDSD